MNLKQLEKDLVKIEYPAHLHVYAYSRNDYGDTAERVTIIRFLDAETLCEAYAKIRDIVKEFVYIDSHDPLIWIIYNGETMIYND